MITVTKRQTRSNLANYLVVMVVKMKNNLSAVKLEGVVLSRHVGG